ncbi:MAG: trimethylamine-N-oxide reductase TorA [Acetobacteraceae bacterium]|nr:trimethylamine-N-oxide reductase TorA [Acetobacteraceae bacterium]
MLNDTIHALLSRRQLLGTSATAAALGLFGPSLLVRGARAAGADGEVLTGSHWGAFYGRVEGGRFTAIRPWEKDPRPSPNLPGILDSVYSPTRIKYPMVRRAFLEKGPGAMPETRGDGDFVRVSWDQALDLVAKELKRVDAAHGPSGTFAGSYGWKSPGKLNNCRTLLYRMFNARGTSFVNATGDYSTGASQVIMPHVVGSLEVYEQQTVWPVVVRDSQLVVFWGADPYTTNDISWGVADHGAYEGLKALKDSGKKVICIDPVRTETCRTLNAEWIAPRPQTDVALMLGIAHTLYTEKLHDEKFLADYTTGFEKFLPYLLGTDDKTPKTAEWAAAICDVPADTIRDLAHRFAANRTMLASGWSVQRQHHGEQVHWMLVTLACMLGQIGSPGGGFGLSYHYASGGAPSATAPVLTGISDGSKTGGAAWMSSAGAASIPLSRVSEMLLHPGETFDFNGKKAQYPDVKLVYWVGGNPFAHHQDRNHMVEAWRKLETFIVQDFQWTATARHADIVLPATSAYERNDIEVVGDYSSSHILAMKQVIDPVFEARSDYDIFTAICDRFGKAREFTEGRSEMDWLRSFYEAALLQAKAKKIGMPDFDTFWKAGVVAFPIDVAAMNFVRHAKFREDPLLEPLGTPSGKIEIYSRNIEKMAYDDCPPHPTWMEPAERLGGPDAKFPLHIATSHPHGRLHSQLAGTVLRKGYTVADREPCLINPKDAASRGIADGDVVRVFNDRGQILAGARITEDMRPGVIRVNEGGWYDPVDPATPGSLCKYGDVNVLTIGIGTSKLAQGNCGHTAIGDIEKYKGVAPPVTVFTAPTASA